MYEKHVRVQLEDGLGGVEVTKFVQEASKYKSSIFVQKMHEEDTANPMNAKDVMGVMALSVNYNDKVIISAEGEDKETAVNKLVEILSQKNC
jgi:phosphotransferase system HPr (HPr) family protein